MPTIIGTALPDKLTGGSDDDLIYGLGGNDWLLGAGGQDTLIGGGGDDYLEGGIGPDLIVLGDGQDMVIVREFESRPAIGQMDVIENWKAGDRLAMGPVNGGPGGYAEGTATDFEGALALASSKIAGGLKYVAVAVGHDVVVFADASGQNLMTANTAVVLAGASLDDISVDNLVFWPIVPQLGRLTGTDGPDTIDGSSGPDSLSGGAGDDWLGTAGFGGPDTIDGGDGNDHIEAVSLNVRLIGGAGNDAMDDTPRYLDAPGFLNPVFSHATPGTIYMDGGEGNDTLRISTPTTHLVTATLIGGAGDDYIILDGDIGATVDAGAGNDTITMTSALSTYAPVVTLGPGVDTFTVDPRPHPGVVITITDFQTGPGGDILDFIPQYMLPAPGTSYPQDHRFVQDGSDADLQIDFDGSGPGGFVTVVRLLNTDASTFVGSANNADIFPIPVAPAQLITSGDDLVAASPAQPEVHAGDGNDTIAGGTGPDVLRGDGGDDSIAGGAAFDDINGNMGNDTAHGGAGDDWVVGGKDNDVLFGDDGSDIVWGNLGNDTLDGGDGNDQVRGGQGDDSLSGGAGDDYISGDRGNDTEAGGAGADVFHSFSGAGVDLVRDFNPWEGDRVMLDPGTTYTVSQVGLDTVIDMGGGDRMILAGVQLASLPAGWIFTG